MPYLQLYFVLQTAAVVDQQLHRSLIRVDADDAIGEGLLLAGHAFDDQGLVAFCKL
jgi:hypothetical protein